MSDSICFTATDIDYNTILIRMDEDEDGHYRLNENLQDQGIHMRTLLGSSSDIVFRTSDDVKIHFSRFFSFDVEGYLEEVPEEVVNTYRKL